MTEIQSIAIIIFFITCRSLLDLQHMPIVESYIIFL